MHVITRGTLQSYWERPGREEAEQPLKAWYAEARRAAWATPADILSKYGSATIPAPGMASFGILGGAHRVVVDVNYGARVVLVRFVGSCEECEASAWGRAAA